MGAPAPEKDGAVCPSVHLSTTQWSDNSVGKTYILFCFRFVLFLFSLSTELLATNSAWVGTLHTGHGNGVASLGGAVAGNSEISG